MPDGSSALDRLISRLGVTNGTTPNGEETLLGRLVARLRQLERNIDDESAALLSRLTARDEELLRSARRLYHACSVVPCLLYYLRTSESPTKFPATISFTIRKGVPRWTHHALWLAGWVLRLTAHAPKCCQNATVKCEDESRNRRNRLS